MRRNHTREFKLQCCRQVATGQKRPAQVCREHNLSESVLRWRREYEAHGEEAFTVGAVFSEQHDEWQLGKRYFSAGSLAKLERKEIMTEQPEFVAG